MLEEHQDLGHLLLLVLIHNVDGFVVVGDGIGFVFCGILLCFDGREDFLDFGFDEVHVNVSDDDDALEVGAIPFLIVCSQFFGFEVVDDAHQADGEAETVAGAGINLGKVSLKDALGSAGAHSPLFVNHAAFLVDFLGVEGQTVCPVVKNEQAAVNVALGHGDVIDVIDRLIGGGVGVEVTTEFHADAFAILDESVTGEVVRAVEAHVFQEVSETALALFFLHAADLLRDVEAGEILGQRVVTDVVGKSVGQLTDAHILVNGQFRNGLRPCRQPHERCQQDKKEFDFFHDEMECKW